MPGTLTQPMTAQILSHQHHYNLPSNITYSSPWMQPNMDLTTDNITAPATVTQPMGDQNIITLFACRLVTSLVLRQVEVLQAVCCRQTGITRAVQLGCTRSLKIFLLACSGVKFDYFTWVQVGGWDVHPSATLLSLQNFGEPSQDCA